MLNYKSKHVEPSTRLLHARTARSVLLDAFAASGNGSQ
jgi:hypothetical protein